jgi:hypothetical protein
MGKKLDKIILTNDDLNFELKNKNSDSQKSKNILYQIPDQVGGNAELQIDDEINEMDEQYDDLESDYESVNSSNSSNSYNSVITNKDEEIEEEIIYDESTEDYDDILKIYQTEEIDKNSNNTGTLISNILNNNKIIEKKKTYMVNFDNSHDNDIDNNDLSYFM